MFRGKQKLRKLDTSVSSVIVYSILYLFIGVTTNAYRLSPVSCKKIYLNIRIMIPIDAHFFCLLNNMKTRNLNFSELRRLLNRLTICFIIQFTFIA